MMIGSGVFTVIAFIIILVEVKGWNTVRFIIDPFLVTSFFKGCNESVQEVILKICHFRALCQLEIACIQILGQSFISFLSMIWLFD